MPSLQGPLAAWSPLLTPTALAGSLRPVGSALAIPAAQDRAAWEGAEADEVTLVAVGQRARELRQQPWPTPRASQFARYWLDGNRTVYEEQVFTRTQRLTFAVLTAAADPAPQLMQLRQSEPVGILDDHHRRIRHIDPHFDDCRRYQHCQLS